jgi:hypothetical protein
MTRSRSGLLAWLVAAIAAPTLLAAERGLAGDDSATAEAAARAIYDAVSAPAGSVPNWDRVRSLFVPEAVVVLRTSRTTTSVFTLDGFIKDFADFYETPKKYGDAPLAPRAAGFTEKVLASRAQEFGEIAHVAVLYEARIVGLSRPPTRGVDLWLLTRQGERWRIAAVVNEVVSADRPLPPDLFASVPPATP